MGDKMICKKCGTDRKQEDFLGKETCYRCQYLDKLHTITKKTRKCRECKAELDSNRWTYCSPECAKIGEKDLKKNYWTHLL